MRIIRKYKKIGEQQAVVRKLGDSGKMDWGNKETLYDL